MSFLNFFKKGSNSNSFISVTSTNISKLTVIEAIHNSEITNELAKLNRRVIGKPGIRSDYNASMWGFNPENLEFDERRFVKTIFISIFHDYFDILNMWYESTNNANLTFNKNIIHDRPESMIVQYSKKLLLLSRVVGTINFNLNFNSFMIGDKNLVVSVEFITNKNIKMMINAQLIDFPIDHGTDIANYNAACMNAVEGIVSSGNFREFLISEKFKPDW